MLLSPHSRHSDRSFKTGQLWDGAGKGLLLGDTEAESHWGRYLCQTWEHVWEVFWTWDSKEESLPAKGEKTERVDSKEGSYHVEVQRWETMVGLRNWKEIQWDKIQIQQGEGWHELGPTGWHNHTVGLCGQATGETLLRELGQAEPLSCKTDDKGAKQSKLAQSW